MDSDEPVSARLLRQNREGLGLRVDSYDADDEFVQFVRDLLRDGHRREIVATFPG